ncbi:MAG: bifunctional metallophosphatase/5'-nucleotidase, partial [Alistipes sp.]
MKNIRRWGLLCLLFAVVACAPQRTVVLLSTNDMHANILNFPKLATAVEACRDTAKIVFLVDAGDRWTGNAYVDMAENRRPMLE